MSITEAQTIDSINTYDELPYESYPFAQTRIENLKTIAHIFGLNTPKLETARVLELGCAAGGNLIPMAVHYPKAKFVGVDLSSAQTKIGNDQIKELGLKNIEIKTISITDIDKSLGEFDYIICHGVISWVPENVRDAILKTCSELLSPTGVAYVSYNTLPGWNMVRSIRDMMLYHSQGFNKVEEQVVQSRLLLDFIKDSLDGMNNPYGEILKTEADLLAGQPNHYLRHDHLEETNYQYYFHEFMAKAVKQDMQYLGDAVLASMYIGNLPPKFVEKMKEIQDIVRSEQYMDFVTNRRFRSTILCKKNVVLSRNIDNKRIENMYFNVNVAAEKSLGDVDLNDNSNLNFFYNNSVENKLNTSNPALKSLLYVFAENRMRYLGIDEIVDLLLKKLPGNKLAVDSLKQEILSNIVKLIFSGHASPCSEKEKACYSISEKPEVSEFVRLQLKWNRGVWVTSELHNRIGIDILDNAILPYLDGKHTEAQLLDKLIENVKAGSLSLDKDGVKITDEAVIRKELEPCIKQNLTKYMQNGLLIR